ncbi:MAG: hypothetical protein WC413_04220 [Candidatus Nanoarchaeia archaeon]
MNKEAYFSRPTADQIIKGKTLIEADRNLLYLIENIKENEALVITTELNPFENSKKYLRHSTELRLKMPQTIAEHIRLKQPPVHFREEAFNNLTDSNYSGYIFSPLKEREQLKRKVSLVNCVKGAKLFTYCTNNTPIDIQEYSAKRASKEGASVIVSVPSRTPKKDRHLFKFISVPTVDNENKYAIAYSLRTEGHNCGDKLFTNVAYKYESSREDTSYITFDTHEIAAYLALCDHFWNKEKNIIPLQMSHFAIPTDLIINLNKKLQKQAVIQRDKNLGTLTEAEFEKFFWAAVKKYGHNKTFFRTDKLKEANWI